MIDTDEDLDNFTGDELSDDLPDFETEDPEPRSGKDQKKASVGSSSPSGRKNNNKLFWAAAGVLIIFLLALAGAILLQQARKPSKIVPSISSVVSLPVPSKTALSFKDFLVPLKPEAQYTCLSFSVVISSRDNRLIQWLSHEKNWFRGNVYDTIVEKIQTGPDMPSPETFRQWITQAVRDALPSGYINMVEIKQFLHI